jgi:hypothetical protein
MNQDELGSKEQSSETTKLVEKSADEIQEEVKHKTHQDLIMRESKEAKDESKSSTSRGLKYVSFLLKAAHSLSKYHTMPSVKVQKLTIKYLKQKEKRIKEGMRYFLSVSPHQDDISPIKTKIILVCKALIKVVSHKEL